MAHCAPATVSASVRTEQCRRDPFRRRYILRQAKSDSRLRVSRFLLEGAALKTTVLIALASLVSVTSNAQAAATEAANKEVIRRLYDAINRHDAKAGSADSAADRKNFGNTVGREGIEDRQADIFTTFPDWHMDIVEMVASGDVVVVRARVSGTHKGVAKMALNGMPVGTPPTGKRFEVTHMHWYRLRDGQVVEHWANRDDLGMLRQLGLVRVGAAQ